MRIEQLYATRDVVSFRWAWMGRKITTTDSVLGNRFTPLIGTEEIPAKHIKLYKRISVLNVLRHPRFLRHYIHDQKTAISGRRGTDFWVKRSAILRRSGHGPISKMARFLSLSESMSCTSVCAQHDQSIWVHMCTCSYSKHPHTFCCFRTRCASKTECYIEMYLLTLIHTFSQPQATCCSTVVHVIRTSLLISQHN
jgi:hypothetical protein